VLNKTKFPHCFSSVNNKNLAIANRSRVSCAHITSTASIGLITMTLKSRSRVTQGHWKRNYWIYHTRLTISRVIWRWILPWPWTVGYRSLKVTQNGTIWKPGYGFIFTFHSNYGRIFSHFADIQHQKMAWPWNGFGVVQSQLKWRGSIDHVRLFIGPPF